MMQPYLPDSLPLDHLDYRLLLPLVGQANAATLCFPRLINLAEGREVL
jgi:hypothetical protein